MTADGAGVRPLLLVSNDDGYRAAGITLLARALGSFADVIVCAPDNEQSASSHSLSLNRPLRVIEQGAGVFSVDGTPADSIYVALHAPHILPRRPDMVVSGMNHGLNLGLDVFYSGTVAAAREGALQGLPALAVSASRETDQEAAAEMATAIAKSVLKASRGKAALYNVNFPPGNSWPLRQTCLGRRVYEGGVVERQDPRGQNYYWIGGSTVLHEGVPGSDTEAYDGGVVGLTPLLLELWAPELRGAASVVLTEYERHQSSFRGA